MTDAGPQSIALVWRARPLELEIQWIGDAESPHRDQPGRLIGAAGRFIRDPSGE